MRNQILAILIFLTILTFSCQTKKFLVVSYNVENLFDTVKNSPVDKDFLPDGPLKWNTEKYQKKLDDLS
ncbi:MAG TPA: endonuclease/exonuclease/phosphatase family protein, partial [Salinivirgaceae bacterium]|nr:endonuclease/exonuclease/phosphatase family protein [Salinivirgaceae bacterium]